MQLPELSFTGRHKNTHTIAGGTKLGLAVTPGSGSRYLAVTYHSEHLLRVYRLEATGATTLMHTLGSLGAGPMQFHYPFKMCLTPSGKLLLCDYGNNRLQELTHLGEEQPKFVRSIPAASVRSVALHADLLAVGTGPPSIELLNYRTGAHIRSIEPNQIGGYCTGMRFTPDGKFIIAAEYRKLRLSMFRVEDCSFVKWIGENLVADDNKDVQFAPNGDLLVADRDNHRVCVFSTESGELLRSWGTEGTPVALTMVGTKLFVLDCDNTSVQVFV